LSPVIEEKHAQVLNLAKLGKERGYLLQDEVNDVLATGQHTTEEIDSLFSTFETDGVDIYEDATAAKAARTVLEVAEPIEPGLQDEVAHGEEIEIEQSPNFFDKSADPVRVYLREMGIVRLLTRELEVVIAKRMERGQLRVLKAISRSPLVLKELIAIGGELREGSRPIKDIVKFDDEELTAEVIAERARHTLRIIDKIEKLYNLSLKQLERFAATAKSNRRAFLRTRRRLARTRVEMSLLVRSIDFKEREKKRLIDLMRNIVERLQSLEREVHHLERRLGAARGDAAAAMRKELRSRRAQQKEIEASTEVGPTSLKRTLTVILRGEAEAERAKR